MKKIVHSLVLVAALFSAYSVQAAPAHSPKISNAAAAEIPRAKGVWIDVRTPEEYAEGHLQGAKNIPFDQIANEIAKVEPNQSAPINLYCKTGRRAGIAKAELEKLGYTNVTNHGGYQDLVKKGLK